jgi:hypothetical protein
MDLLIFIIAGLSVSQLFDAFSVTNAPARIGPDNSRRLRKLRFIFFTIIFLSLTVHLFPHLINVSSTDVIESVTIIVAIVSALIYTGWRRAIVEGSVGPGDKGRLEAKYRFRSVSAIALC